MVDPNAPIIPHVGMGGISLKCTAEELRQLLSEAKLVWENKAHARYDIEDMISLFIMKGNGKIYKLVTLESYKGKLFDKISTETTEKELLAFEPSFIYDDFEEVFVSKKGVFIETDPVTLQAKHISVYVEELDRLPTERFWQGDW